MPLIRVPRPWEIPQSCSTPESACRDRRRFLRDMGQLGIGAAALLLGCSPPTSRGAGAGSDAPPDPPPGGPGLYPAPRRPEYVAAAPPTDEMVAARHNNFYEFTERKDVWRHVERFETRPWEVEVAGLCHRPRTFDIDDLVRSFPLEERVYRFRCVEAWSMVVPWTGFPLRALIDSVEPRSAARHVRMLAFLRPEQAPGQRRMSWYPWPYYEGLTLEEARNELAFMVTGIYGHALPAQHGAPIRLVVPWKYGFKSIKSIVRIELVARRPSTFWSDSSDEYDFWANVNPNVPHPRWSQATERRIDTGEVLPTRIFNGYAEQVAAMYPWEPRRPRG
ncbi:MAG: protein-methionine-sulfoxide reductase catalytic subunit MsrP [Acidobacteriota bacterium]